ncbi:helix-turn-helix domain-containing protein [Luteipulveratus halotolerans]|uniref:helix-turn-helix domain-containing protein n=1 Tax=Luteipulveratus halotolerans TaxID=1631356 RepID=UPI0008FC0885
MHSQPAFRPDALRAAREGAGLTQHQLAHLIGVAGGERVSRWELGTSTPRAAMVGRLARALDVRISDLLAADDRPDLRRLRLEAGYGSREAARRAHVAPATYLRWEAGAFRSMPSERVRRHLAGVLGVSMDVLRDALDESRRRRDSA